MKIIITEIVQEIHAFYKKNDTIDFSTEILRKISHTGLELINLLMYLHH